MIYDLVPVQRNMEEDLNRGAILLSQNQKIFHKQSTTVNEVCVVRVQVQRIVKRPTRSTNPLIFGRLFSSVVVVGIIYYSFDDQVELK